MGWMNVLAFFFFNFPTGFFAYFSVAFPPTFISGLAIGSSELTHYHSSINPPTLELGNIFLDQNCTFEHFSPWIFFDETVHIDYLS